MHTRTCCMHESNAAHAKYEIQFNISFGELADWIGKRGEYVITFGLVHLQWGSDEMRWLTKEWDKLKYTKA